MNQLQTAMYVVSVDAAWSTKVVNASQELFNRLYVKGQQWFEYYHLVCCLV